MCHFSFLTSRRKMKKKSLGLEHDKRNFQCKYETYLLKMASYYITLQGIKYEIHFIALK